MVQQNKKNFCGLAKQNEKTEFCSFFGGGGGG